MREFDIYKACRIQPPLQMAAERSMFPVGRAC